MDLRALIAAPSSPSLIRSVAQPRSFSRLHSSTARPSLPDSARTGHQPQPGGVIVFAPGSQLGQLAVAADKADHFQPRIQQACPAPRRSWLDDLLPPVPADASAAQPIEDRRGESSGDRPSDRACDTPAAAASS